MAASPEVMQANGGPPPDAAPAAGPMMTPQPNAGEQEGAKVQLTMALKICENALGKYDSKMDEHKAILKAITNLAKVVGKTEEKSEQYMPAEIKAINQGLLGPGQPPKPPAPPGAAPGGPPPGAAPPPPGAM